MSCEHEGHDCVNCGQPFDVPDEFECTDYCNVCAQNLASDVLPLRTQLGQTQRREARLREALTEIRDYPSGREAADQMRYLASAALASADAPAESPGELTAEQSQELIRIIEHAVESGRVINSDRNELRNLLPAVRACAARAKGR